MPLIYDYLQKSVTISEFVKMIRNHPYHINEQEFTQQYQKKQNIYTKQTTNDEYQRELNLYMSLEGQRIAQFKLESEQIFELKEDPKTYKYADIGNSKEIYTQQIQLYLDLFQKKFKEDNQLNQFVRLLTACLRMNPIFRPGPLTIVQQIQCIFYGFKTQPIIGKEFSLEKYEFDLIKQAQQEFNQIDQKLEDFIQQKKKCKSKLWGNVNEQVLGEAEYIINNISQLEKNYQNQLLDVLKKYRKGIICFNNLEILNESLNLRGIQNVKSIRLEKDLFGQYKFVNQTDTNFDNLKKLINDLANKEKDEPTISTLAHLHYYGDNIFKENTKLACKLAENSVNNKLSQFLLGSMYLDGIVKQQNYEMAFQYFHKSFQQGLTQSLTNLGYMFNSGKGVKKDQKMAFKLNEKAALLNNQVAMYNLGYFYEEGLGGIQKNLKLSQYWYNKSAQKGYIKAMEKFYPQKVIVSYKILFDK